MGSLTVLIRLGALVSDAACDISKEGLGFADTLEINAAVLGDGAGSTFFLCIRVGLVDDSFGASPSSVVG